MELPNWAIYLVIGGLIISVIGHVSRIVSAVKNSGKEKDHEG